MTRATSTRTRHSKSAAQQTHADAPSSFRPQHLAIADAVRAIARGTTASYAEVARRAGQPRGARLVVWVLKHAPAHWQLPWHRVHRADGAIAFEPGSAAFKKQSALLKQEGVTVVNGKIKSITKKSNVKSRGSVKRATSLDELLWR